MLTIGLRDLFYAPITISAENQETYGSPVRLAKAISVDMGVEVAEAPLYADDSIDFIMKEFVGGEITLETSDIAPKEVAFLLGQTQDDDGVIYAGENDNAPYVAVGFRARKTDGSYRFVWLYKVKFGIPSETFKTKEASIEYQKPQITGKFMKRPDGNWKADYTGKPDDSVAVDWFKSVREKSAA